MSARRAPYILAVVFLLVGLHVGSNNAFAQVALTAAVPYTVSVNPQSTVPVLVTGCCYIEVPIGTAVLTIHMNASGGDVDLYARFGQDVELGGPTIGSIRADYSAQGPTGTETITINLPRPGRWYFASVVWTPNVDISRTITATPSAAITANTLVIPQFVSGGGWSTTLFLTNVSTLSESLNLNFFGESGGARDVTLLGSGSVPSVATTLAPGQTVVYETTSTGTLDVGWASVTLGTTNNRVTGFAIFRYGAAGAPDSEAIVNLGNTVDQNLVMLYDQMNGFSTGLALVNPGASPVTLNAAIRDASGTTIGTGTITLPPYSHQASFISERFPITANKRGSVVIDGTAGFSILGLRFNPSGTFTSFLPLR
jgi:hypothetical protein